MSHIKAKMHQIRFRLRLCHTPGWDSLQRFPTSSIVGFKGLTSKALREREGRIEREKCGREKKEKEEMGGESGKKETGIWGNGAIGVGGGYFYPWS